MKLKSQKVTVLLGDPSLPDTVKKGGHFNEEDFTTIDKLKAALQELEKFEFTYLDNHQQLISEFATNKFNLVFNLCDEGYSNDALKELHIPALLEIFNVPYTGAGPACLALCYDKANVRAIAQTIGIPVPREIYIAQDDQTIDIPSSFPVIIKPNLGDSSIGITQDSVVSNVSELNNYISYLKDLMPGKPLLVQEYLRGAEYSVGILGNPDQFEVLPILEVDYNDLDPTLPKILSYESKWLPESSYWNDIKYKTARLEDRTKQRLIDCSKRLFERTGCRDYARFDFRCDDNGDIKLLEVNPNPGWCWDGKLNLMAEYAGISYALLLEMILTLASEREGL